MMKSWALTIVLLGCLAGLSSCSSDSLEPRVHPAPKITPNDPVNPTRIRFDVYGDPYSPAPPGSEEAKLPMHLQIRAGMRRYAAEKLKELHYCQHGFKRPDMVLAPERNRLQSFFYVECLPPP